GQATPVDAVLAAIERLGARIAVVAATLPEHLEPWVAARETVEDLHRHGTAIVWGGPGAASAAARGLPGPAALTIDDAVVAVVGLLERTTPARGEARVRGSDQRQR
ncbi:MAG: hypothetical protein QN168_00005, partial [Armatimonadota bacterium]|nr:hypothetical protein [Armatimonadota bacterium]